MKFMYIFKDYYLAFLMENGMLIVPMYNSFTTTQKHLRTFKSMNDCCNYFNCDLITLTYFKENTN